MNTSFFTQFIARLAKDNPKFFKYVQWGALGLAGVSASLKYINGGVSLPWFLEWLKDNSVLVGSIVTTVMAQLPNTCPICQKNIDQNEKNTLPPGNVGLH